MTINRAFSEALAFAIFAGLLREKQA
jgi:hypothetical protein